MVEKMYSTAVITVSDRSYKGEREDTAGPAVAEMLEKVGFKIAKMSIVPDIQSMIEAELIELADEEGIALIVTTGGTGFSPRDVTPEATKAVCARMVPGIPDAMRAESMKYTNRAVLSRAASGIRRGSLIINLPGNPKAALENLQTVLPSLEHGLTMLLGGPQDCAKIDK